MNSTKNGNLIKPVAFFVIIVILLLTVVIVASGWHTDTTEPDSGNAEDGADDVPTSGEADNDTNPDNQTPEPPENTIPEPEPKPEVPENLSPLTGLEISPTDGGKLPLCFIIDSTAPNYGTSYSPLIIEVPTEDGRTRSLLFTYSAESLGKLGSITSTRSYLTMLAKDFGGILVSLGSDSNLNRDDGEGISLSVNTGYHYTEYSTFSYSNGDLIKAMLKNLGVDMTDSESKPVFNFVGYFDEEITAEEKAEKLNITYSSSNKTSFVYSSDDEAYILHKNGSEYHDLLNDKPSLFKNILVLFANCTTYETDEYTETHMDITGGGRGLYLTGGTVKEISWSRNADGELLFTADEAPLIINRGNTYISFVKSSQTNTVEYST